MTRITDYTSLAAAAAADELVIVDVSDTTMSAAGTTKKVTTTALLGVGAGTVNVLPYGADATGSADSTAAFLAAASALPAQGGTVIVPPGTYKISGGSAIINAVTPTTFWGPAGKWATRINFTGTGDCITLQNPTYGGGGHWGGGIKGIYINGNSAGSNSSGLHFGDGEQYELDVAVEHFNQSGSIGVHADNQIWWTEKMHGRIWARDCTSHVIFDVNPAGATTAENSFGYLDLLIDVYVQPGQDGVVVQNGALPYHGPLLIKGDVANQTASPASNALLRVTGQMPAGHPNSNYSQIIRCQFDLLGEVPANASGLTYQPYGIYIDSAANNGIFGCYGMIDLTQGGGLFQPCNLNIASNVGTFTYDGLITGDANLNPSASQPGMVTLGSKLYGQSFMSGSAGTAYLQWGDFFACTLSSSITVDLNPAGQSGTISAPQRKTFKISQAAAGGPYTVTWPKPGSPSLTAPAVYWPGGVAPTMSSGASAVDFYYLTTYDGVHWYGQAVQAFS